MALAGLIGWYLWRMILETRMLARSIDADTEVANTILQRISFARSLWLPRAKS